MHGSEVNLTHVKGEKIFYYPHEANITVTFKVNVKIVSLIKAKEAETAKHALLFFIVKLTEVTSSQTVHRNLELKFYTRQLIPPLNVYRANVHTQI